MNRYEKLEVDLGFFPDGKKKNCYSHPSKEEVESHFKNKRKTISESLQISKSEYVTIHKWIRETYGSANHCENKNCYQTSNLFEWAKKSGMLYEKKRDNFIQLCRSCHRKYDTKNFNEIQLP